MKRVNLAPVMIAGQLMKATDVLTGLVKAPPPGQGFDLIEMRSRLKVIDRLEGAGTDFFVDLEDAEHATLKRALEQSSFVLADRGLLAIIDGVINAKAPISPALPQPEPEARLD
jgi:hypothetical protein